MKAKKSKPLSKCFALFCAAFFLAINVKASDNVSTNDIIKEIEKTLLFDKDSTEQIDFYRQKISKKKSSITINEDVNKTEEDAEQLNSVEIFVVNPKVDNSALLAKEKLAYNSILVGQYEVAVELYKQILASDQNNSYVKFSLAVVYQKMSQYSQAKSLYYELLKTQPDNSEEIVGNLLAILIEESPREAIYLLSRLAVQNPTSSYILAQAANANEKIKNYDQSINLLNKAIAFEPNNLDYRYNLAVIYDKMGNYDKALEAYMEIVRDQSGDKIGSIPFGQIEERIEYLKGKV